MLGQRGMLLQLGCGVGLPAQAERAPALPCRWLEGVAQPVPLAQLAVPLLGPAAKVELLEVALDLQEGLVLRLGNHREDEDGDQAALQQEHQEAVLPQAPLQRRDGRPELWLGSPCSNNPPQSGTAAARQ